MSDKILDMEVVRTKVHNALSDFSQEDEPKALLMVLLGEGVMSCAIEGVGSDLAFALHRLCHDFPGFDKVLGIAYKSFQMCLNDKEPSGVDEEGVG